MLGRAVMFEVKAIGPSIVPAIPEADASPEGSALPRLQGVEARLRNLVRVLAVVHIEQL
jgi:hypothetical protein